MTLKEFYESLGVEYEVVLNRLRREDRIAKYLRQFIADPAFEQLRCAMEAAEHEEAFRAAHTIKGMCLNLSLGRLSDAACTLVEALRAGDAAGAQREYDVLQPVYTSVCGQVGALDVAETG